MSGVNHRVITVASLALAALAWLLPCAILSGEAASRKAHPSASARKRQVSEVQIGEVRVGRKTFTTGKSIVKATPALVWDVLTDYNGGAAIFSNLTKSRLISSSGPTKIVSVSGRTVGSLFKFDYTVKMTEVLPDRIEWKRVSGSFKANEGYWKLEPREGGKATFVTYAKHVDVGFLVPQALAKRSVRDSIPVIFAELKHAVESSRQTAGGP